MAYDHTLAQRIRDALAGRPSYSERKMFGGIAFMAGGNMVGGVLGDRIMVRVGPANYETLLALPHVSPMDFNGRPMKGMLSIAAAGIADDKSLQLWLERGWDFAALLPPK
jgi:TfoX/Sxy family transcriptional regulator of competence genes